jgi:Meckel syndrome type 1 protein
VTTASAPSAAAPKASLTRTATPAEGRSATAGQVRPMATATAAVTAAAVTAASSADASDDDAAPGQDDASSQADGATSQTTQAPAAPDASQNLAAAGAPGAVQAQATTPAALAAAHGAAMTSQLAEQIAKKAAGGKATQFDIALDPDGLGKVNVKVQIDASGQLSAQIAFDNPAAAAEAKARAADLQQALAQAGFDVGQGGLSFQSSGQDSGLAWNQGGSGGGGSAQAQGWAGDTTTDDASTQSPASVRTADGAVDITI